MGERYGIVCDLRGKPWFVDLAAGAVRPPICGRKPDVNFDEKDSLEISAAHASPKDDPSIVYDQSGEPWFVDNNPEATRPVICGASSDGSSDPKNTSSEDGSSAIPQDASDLNQVLRELGSSKERGSNYAHMIAALTNHLLRVRKEMEAVRAEIKNLQSDLESQMRLLFSLEGRLNAHGEAGEILVNAQMNLNAKLEERIKAIESMFLDDGR